MVWNLTLWLTIPAHAWQREPEEFCEFYEVSVVERVNVRLMGQWSIVLFSERAFTVALSDRGRSHEIGLFRDRQATFQ